jgi:WD40 repeat protein
MTARPSLLAAAAAVALGLAVWATVAGTARQTTNRVIRVIAISPDGKGLAIGTAQGAIHACDSASLMNCQTFETDGVLNDLRYSERGELLIADRNIRLATRDGGQVRQIRGDGANYGAVRFSPDERSVLTIDGKGVVMTVDLDSGRASPAYCCSSIWGSVEFLDQGRRAVWAGHWPGIWDLTAGQLVGRLTAQRQEMTFGPIAVDAVDGLVYLGSQDGRVYQWNARSREALEKSVALAGYVMTISLLGTSGWVAYASQPGVVHLWDPKTGTHRVVQDARTSSNIVFDPQRGLAVFGTESGGIEFWDLPRGRRVESKTPPIALSPIM